MKSTLSRHPPTVVVCPGNGCSNIRRSNWDGRFHDKLVNDHKIQCVCEDFPDPVHARRDIWVPHMRSLAEKHCGANSESSDIVFVGHSSGAQAALRYAEKYPVHGIILVSATYSDLDNLHERASGYYPQKIKNKEETNPYLFEKMKKNCKNWIQFHSNDDPFIPLREAEQIRDGLGLKETYHMLPGRSHFFEYFPE